MGEPAGGYTPAPTAEHIGCMEASRGTETSQYPEEKKSTEIPEVAASEPGFKAQTVTTGKTCRCWRDGVVGAVLLDTADILERL